MSLDDKKRPEIEIKVDSEIEKEKNTELLHDLAEAKRVTEITRSQVDEAMTTLQRRELAQDLTTDSSIDMNINRDDRLIALLCYVFPFIMSTIVLISKSSQSRSFQKYHAVQGLGLALGLGLLGTAVAMFASLITIGLPFIGFIIGILLFCLSPIGFAMGALAHLYYGFQAYNGKRFAIPIITSFLRNQGWL